MEFPSELVYNINQEDYKYKKWIFTWNETNDGFLVDEQVLENLLKALMEEYAFQKERVTRTHYQGYFKTKVRARKKTVLNLFNLYMRGLPPEALKQLTIINAKGTTDEIITYVSKSESRISETRYSALLQPYQQSDLAVLSQRDKWYPWQDTLHNLLFIGNVIRKPDDRTIIWIRDILGNSGKSKLVKYYVYNHPNEIVKIPFGSSTQLRSSICAVGPRKLYFIDIPRTLGREDNIDDLLSVIEDIKNGFVVSGMYGKHQQLLFEPPHIVVFSNMACPTKKLSGDRWVNYDIEYAKILSLIC